MTDEEQKVYNLIQSEGGLTAGRLTALSQMPDVRVAAVVASLIISGKISSALRGGSLVYQVC
jgi:hypothetical protein